MENGFEQLRADLRAYRQKVNEILERCVPKIEALTKEAAEASDKEFGQYQRDTITKVFNEEIDKFYADYTPKVYTERNHSLYDILSIPTNERGLVSTSDADFRDFYDKEKMTKTRKGGSLFDTVFVKGYHGGASFITNGTDDYGNDKILTWGAHPNPGVPYYRTRGRVKYASGVSRTHRYGKWGRKATKSKSPMYQISFRVDQMWQSDWPGVFREIGQKYSNELGRKGQEEINKIAKEVFGRG